MTGYDLALALTAELKRLGAPMIGSFAWSPDRLVLDYWTDEGHVEHVTIIPGPVRSVEDTAALFAGAMRQ